MNITPSPSSSNSSLSTNSTAPVVASSLVTPKPGDTTTLVSQVGRSALNEYNVWERFCQKIKLAFHWIKDIPSKISDYFRSCFEEEIDDYDYDDDDLYSSSYTPPVSIVSPDVLDNLKKTLDLSVFNSIITRMDEYVKGIIPDIALINFKTIDDLNLFEEITYTVNEHILQVSDLMQIIPNPIPDNSLIKQQKQKLDELAVRFDNALKSLQNREEADKVILAKLREDRKVLQANQNNPYNQMVLHSPGFIKTQPEASIKEYPPAFQNSGKNDCWFHASLQIFCSHAPFFHKLILEAENEKDRFKAEYDKNLKAFEQQKRVYDQKMLAHVEDLKKVEAYKTQFNKYKNEQAIFKKEQEKALEVKKAYKKELEAYELKLKEWEQSDQTAPRPDIPSEPPMKELIAPIQPEEVQTPLRPVEPQRPSDPMKLLNVLKQFCIAVQKDDRREIDRVAKKLHDELGNYYSEYNQFGVQHDPRGFFDMLLEFLNKPQLKVATIREGLADSSFAGYKQTHPETHNVIEFPMQLNTSNFQELFDDYFSKKIYPYDPNNAVEMTRTIKENDREVTQTTRVPQFTEHRQIDTSIPLPNILFVQLMRWRGPTQQELANERVHEEKKRQEIIVKHAEHLKKTKPDTYKDKSQKEIESAAEAELKSLNKLPNYQVNYLARKIETPILLEQGQFFNVAKAIGQDAHTPECQYKLVGTIRHYGGYGGGHYVANVLGNHPKNGQKRWYHTDDIGSVVKPLELETAIEENQHFYFGVFEKVIPSAG